MEQPLLLFVDELWLATKQNVTFSSCNNTYVCIAYLEIESKSKHHMGDMVQNVNHRNTTAQLSKRCPCLMVFLVSVAVAVVLVVVCSAVHQVHHRDALSTSQKKNIQSNKYLTMLSSHTTCNILQYTPICHIISLQNKTKDECVGFFFSISLGGQMR